MKRTFWTRNLCIGVLAGLVMVLGVQGITEALTLKATSDKVQSKLSQSTFEISFSVGLKSPAIAYNTQRKRISDHNTPDDQVRIDSQGYKVFDTVNNREFRLLAAQPTGTYYLGTGPAYTNQGNVPGTASGTFYTDTGNNVVDATGKPVYERTGTGTRNDPDTPDVNENDPYRYTRLKALPEAAIDEADRFDFNEEQITVSVTGPSTSFILRDKRDGQSVVTGDATTAITGTMLETSFYKKLMSSVTLVTNELPEGTYTITITDSTGTGTTPNNDDFPVGQVPTPAPIVFTLYVEDDAAPTGALNFSEASGSLLRLDTERSIEPIHTHFDLTAANLENKSIRYKVTKGSGLLYVGTPDREDTTPVSDLTIHKAAMVYLKVNKTNNEVVAAIAGRDLRTHGKTLVFSYTGTDRRSSTAAGDTTSDTRPTIPVSSTSLSGAPGTVQSFTITGGPTAVSVSGSTFTTAGGSISVSGRAVSVRLPSSPGSSYNLLVSATGYQPRTITVRVTGPAPDTPAEEEEEEDTRLGTLTITKFGNQVGTQQQIRVSASPRPSSDVPFTVSRGGVQITSSAITTAGTGSAVVTVPATGLYTLTVTASGYTTKSVTFTAGAPITTPTTTTTSTPTTTTTTTTDEEPEPDSLEISGEATRTNAVVNTPLTTPLVVEVLDADGTGVPDTRVIFRVRTGQGSLQERGDGRGTTAETDRRGFASTPYTPMSTTSTVEAEVRGIQEKVTFTITTGSAPPTATTPTTGATRSYKVGDRLPGSLSGTYNFSGKLTINNQMYTCTSAGECVISNGIVTQGQIQIADTAKPEPTVTTRQYRVGDRLPGNLSGTYNFSGKLTMNGQTYTCLSSGECVISNGIVTRGQIQTTVATTPKDATTPQTISPIVHVAAAKRPSMLWVDGGAIYTLIGANVQRFAPSLNNVISLAIGGGETLLDRENQ